MAAFKLRSLTGTFPEWSPSIWPSRFRTRILSGQALDGMASGTFKGSRKTGDVFIYEYEWDTLPKSDMDALEIFRNHTDTQHSLRDLELHDSYNFDSSPLSPFRWLPDTILFQSEIGTLRDGFTLRLVKGP